MKKILQKNEKYTVPVRDSTGNIVEKDVPVHPNYVMHGGDNGDNDGDIGDVDGSNGSDDNSTVESKYDTNELVKYILFTTVVACIVICIVKIVRSIYEEQREVEKYIRRKGAVKSSRHARI